jgi:hypothetical protein
MLDITSIARNSGHDKFPTFLRIDMRARIDAIRERIGAQLVSEIIELIADEVESRGDRKLDLDPGETSDWLRTFLND